jgi:large subunit ribosomal protein L37Ae
LATSEPKARDIDQELFPHRYGASLRKQVKKAEVSQHARYICTFCGKNTVKRKAVGIWECKGCNKTVAGGAYVVS